MGSISKSVKRRGSKGFLPKVCTGEGGAEGGVARCKGVPRVLRNRRRKEQRRRGQNLDDQWSCGLLPVGRPPNVLTATPIGRPKTGRLSQGKPEMHVFHAPFSNQVGGWTVYKRRQWRGRVSSRGPRFNVYLQACTRDEQQHVCLESPILALNRRTEDRIQCPLR